MRTIVCTVLAALLMAPAGVHAQVSAIRPDTRPIGPAAASSFREAIDKEAARLITTPVRDSARQTPVRQRNWVARHPVLTGTLVGAGIGLGFLVAHGCESSDYTCSGLVAFYGGTGAGLGAAAGAVVGIVLR